MDYKADVGTVRRKGTQRRSLRDGLRELVEGGETGNDESEKEAYGSVREKGKNP